MRPSSSAGQQNDILSNQLNFKSFGNTEIESAFHPRKELSIGSEWTLRSNVLGKNETNVVYTPAYPANFQNLNKSPEDFITTNPIDFDKDLKQMTYVEDPHSPDSMSLSKNSKKIKKLSKEITPDNLKLKEEKGKGKKNPWQPSEDAKVLELLGCYGQSWALIAAALGNRTGKQVRDRYLNYLRPDIKDADFTIQEDRLLLALYYQMGHKWSKIASHMSGRTECQVKNRFYAHIKKRLMFPDFNAKNMAQANNIASALFENENKTKKDSFRDEIFIQQQEKKEEYLSAGHAIQSSPEDQAYSTNSSKSNEVICIDGQGGNGVFMNQAVQNNGNGFNFVNQVQVQNMQQNQPFLSNKMLGQGESQNMYLEHLNKVVLNRNPSLERNISTSQKSNEQSHTEALLSLENELINKDKLKRYEELMRRKNALEFFYTKTLQEMNDLKNMDFGIPNIPNMF